MHQPTGRSIVFVLVDATFIVGAVWTAAYVRLGDVMTQVIERDDGLLKMLLMAGVIQASLFFRDLYDVSVVSDRQKVFTHLVEALAVASLILAVLYFRFPDLIVGRGVFAIAAAFTFVFVIGWRLLFDVFTRVVGRTGSVTSTG